VQTFNLASGQEFNFFAGKISNWKGWLASLVVDSRGNTFGSDGTSKSVGNQTDLQLLIALRSKAALIVTTGKTARSEQYKASRFAPIAFITKDHQSLASIPAVEEPGSFENIFLSSDKPLPNAFNDFDYELSGAGLPNFLFEGGLESLKSLLKSKLEVTLVLSIANVQDFDEPKALELLNKILPDWSNPQLQEAFYVGPNLVTIWTKPAS
jgi:hypothetical protein